MNYYPFHIGDYVSATRHLSWCEDAAFRRLLDTYYTTEKPLPEDLRAVCRLVLATTEEQREAVRIVLEEFFELTECGWINHRADVEIAAMRKKQQDQRDKANKRWKKPSTEPGSASAVPQHKESDAAASNSDANAMPPTPTPTPKEQEKPKDRRVAALTTGQLQADGLSEETADEWLAHRKRKGSPLTPRAWASLKAEVSKAGWTLEDAVQKALGRGWTGIEAEWLRNQQRPQGRDPPRESIHEKRARTMSVLTGSHERPDDPFTIEVPAHAVG